MALKKLKAVIPMNKPKLIRCDDCIHYNHTDHPAVKYCAKIKMHQAVVSSRVCFLKETK